MTQTNDGMTPAELESQDVTAVPDREAMSLLGESLDPSALMDTSLLNVDVDLALDADVAAPIDAAVAANANVAAPIDAAVAANVLSVDSEAAALADQDSVIIQDLDGTAEATATQDATVDQSGGGAVTG
ncbi:MAG: hypothetical protein ACLGI2_17045 [Acidimicrobiia bacterium]